MYVQIRRKIGKKIFPGIYANYSNKCLNFRTPIPSNENKNCPSDVTNWEEIYQNSWQSANVKIKCQDVSKTFDMSVSSVPDNLNTCYLIIACYISAITIFRW